MNNIKENKQAFSILVVVFMIGFLLVLTVWVFNLIIMEVKGNRGLEDSIKAYEWAQGAMELALLEIKSEWYWFDEDIGVGSDKENILSFNSSNKKWRQPSIYIDMDIAVMSHSGSIGTGETVIIPLFTRDDRENIISAEKPSLTVTDNEGDLIWGIIGDGLWLSWTGNFDHNTWVDYRNKAQDIENLSIEEFLDNNSWSYLTLSNKSTADEINYTLTSYREFSRPKGHITTSAIVGKQRQSISSTIDNSKFLEMLKYSFYNTAQ